MGKALNRCSSLHRVVPGGAKSCRFLESAEHGVWAIAQDLEAADGRGSALLLDALREQVASGEDLTAALLVAHGRVQREMEQGPDAYVGARVIGMRLNRSTSSFEIAWVGDMQAHLVRDGQVLQLSAPSGQRGAVGQTQTNALQMTATRVPGLGRPERGRPVIDRKLGHAQAGDLLVLSSEALSGGPLAAALQDTLKGVWSLDYKLQKLQGRLAGELPAEARLPLLIWRGK